MLQPILDLHLEVLRVFVQPLVLLSRGETKDPVYGCCIEFGLERCSSCRRAQEHSSTNSSATFFGRSLVDAELHILLRSKCSADLLECFGCGAGGSGLSGSGTTEHKHAQRRRRFFTGAFDFLTDILRTFPFQ